MNQNEIDRAFASMKVAERELAEQINNKALADHALEAKIADLGMKGKIKGANTEERKANLLSETFKNREKVDIAAAILVLRKRDHAIAKAEVDRVKYTIRYMEIAAHAASNG